MRPALLLTALLLATPIAGAQHHDHARNAPADAAAIPTGLTADEAAGLAAGAGMGLARPADLGGYPGPLHVLELADDLALTDAQRAEAERLRAAMLAEAVPLGEQILEVERHLDALFASGEATPEAIQRVTAHAATLRGRLRAVHLTTHLGMRAALTAEQTARYAALRGHAH